MVHLKWWRSASFTTFFSIVKATGGALEIAVGRLKVVLEAYVPTAPGFFLCFPSRARSSAPLRLFIEAARDLAMRGVK